MKLVAFVDVDAGVALKRSSSSGVRTKRPSSLLFPPLPPFCPLCDPLPIRCIGGQQSESVLSDNYGEIKMEGVCRMQTQIFLR